MSPQPHASAHPGTRWSVLLLTALLAACTPTEPPAPTPAPTPGTPAGGVYQLSIQVTGQNTAQASLHRIAPPTLQTQQLENAPDAIALTLPAITAMTFITQKNGVDMRHISTTLRVTNTTTQPLSNLTLLPVILTDTDGDPSNNATSPTLPGTPYRNVRLYDGTDAPEQASTITLTQAQTVNLSTGESQPDQAATPFLTNLNLTSLAAPAPAGLSMTVMNQGWLAADQLGPAGTVPVTFAVDLPINRNAPKTQVFSFSIILIPTQDKTGTNVGLNTNPGVLQGTMPNWTYSGAPGITFNVNEEYVNSPSGTPNRKQTLPLNADGAIEMPLLGPDPSNLQPLLDDTCTFTGERSRPNVGHAIPRFSIYSNQNDPMGYVRERDQNNQTIKRLYAEQPITVKGTNNCQIYATTYDLTLKQGWNLINETTSTAPDGTPIITQKTLPSTTRTRLNYQQQGPFLTIQQPTYGSDLTLTAGQSTNIPFSFLQSGGINGPVTIETNIPGLTVTPNTLTFAKLTAQALQTNLTLTADPSLTGYNDALVLTFRQNGQIAGRTTYFLTVK